MTNESLQNRLIPILAIVIVCIQPGCSVNKFRKTISNFEAATSVVTAQTHSVLTEINRLERNRIITEHRQDNRPILISDIIDSRLIAQSDLEVRLDALDRLNEYVDLLVRIANDDAPGRIAKSASDLSKALHNLTVTVNSQAAKNNTGFKEKFGAAGSVLSQVLQTIAQKKMKEAVETAILKGEEPINRLIAAIGDDLEVAFINRKAALEKKRTDLLEQYNTEVVKNIRSKTMLDDLSKKIISNEDMMDTMTDANPRAALTAMEKAHSTLVIHAKYKSSMSFEEAVDAIEIFVAASKRLGDAVLKFKTQST